MIKLYSDAWINQMIKKNSRLNADKLVIVLL